MKNKKILILLLILTCFTFNVKQVSAVEDDVDETITKYQNVLNKWYWLYSIGSSGNNDSKVDNSSYTDYLYRYSIKFDDEEKDAWCLNPNLSSAEEYEVSTYYSGGTYTEGIESIYDEDFIKVLYGILAYDEYRGTSDENTRYTAIRIALRTVYAYFYPAIDYNSINNETVLLKSSDGELDYMDYMSAALYNTAIEWNEALSEEVQKELFYYSTTGLSNDGKYMGYKSSSSSSTVYLQLSRSVYYDVSALAKEVKTGYSNSSASYGYSDAFVLLNPEDTETSGNAIIKWAYKYYLAGMEYAYGTAFDTADLEDDFILSELVPKEQTFDGQTITKEITLTNNLKTGEKVTLSQFYVVFEEHTVSGGLDTSYSCSLNGSDYEDCGELEEEILNKGDEIVVKIEVDVPENNSLICDLEDYVSYSIKYAIESSNVLDGLVTLYMYSSTSSSSIPGSPGSEDGNKTDTSEGTDGTTTVTAGDPSDTQIHVGTAEDVENTTPGTPGTVTDIPTEGSDGIEPEDVENGYSGVTSDSDGDGGSDGNVSDTFGITVTGKIDTCYKICETDYNLTEDCKIEGEDNVGTSEDVVTEDFIVTNTDDLDDYGYYCYINNVDSEENGNTYVVSDACDEDAAVGGTVENDYCTLSCYEEYSNITYSGIQLVDSGRTLSIGASITGTKTCIASIDYDKYESDLASASSAEKTTIIENMDKCLVYDSVDNEEGWFTQFDETKAPTVSYSYDSNYTFGDSGEMEVSVSGDDNIFYCDSLDEDGDCNTKYTGAEISGLDVGDYGYIMYSVTSTFEYNVPSDIFFQIDGTGVVISAAEASSYSGTMLSDLPIALSTEKGSYEFSFEVSSIGEYYDNCGNFGRLDELYYNQSGNSLASDVGYICYYLVNVECAECETSSEFSISIDENYTDSPTALVSKSEFNLYFNPISLTTKDNFNTTDKDLGYNWNYEVLDDSSYDYTTDSTYGLLNAKSAATVDNIYEVDTTYESTGDAILTVELTPAMATEISKYNDSVNSYSNATLYCGDLVGDDDEVIAESVFCVSTMLSEWSEGDYSDYFTFNSSSVRPDGTTDFDYEVDDFAEGSDNYWDIIDLDVEATEIGTTYELGGLSWK